MITSIGHIAFRVTSLQRALDFYCNKLGFSEVFRLDQEGQPSPWIVYIQIAPGTFLEFFLIQRRACVLTILRSTPVLW